MNAALPWGRQDPAELARRWKLPSVHLQGTVGSTNDVARAFAAAGAPAGTLVIASEQTAGRGRGGKRWASAPGLGLWMSMVLRPRPPADPSLLPILVGLAVAEALEPMVRPAAAQVKWPNDVLIAGRKVAGILCEGVIEPGGGAAIVAGIGVNVGHCPDDFPPELAETATSLRAAGGWAPPLADVAGAIVAAVRHRAWAPPSHLGGGVLTALSERDALAGHLVRVEGQEVAEGTAIGINPGGALLVRVDGALRTFHAGTIRIVGRGDAR